MKKVLLSVIVTVCVMTGIGYCVIMNVCQDYEETIADITELYEDSEATIAELESDKIKLCEDSEATIAELESDKAELSDGVYNMMNDKPYSITIDHNGAKHTYEAKDNKGFIRDKTHYVVH